MYRFVIAATCAMLSVCVAACFLAGVQEEKDKADEINRYYQQVAANGNDMTARRNLMGALHRAGRADEELIQLRDIYYHHPDQYDVVYNYGWRCYYRGDYAEAEKCLSSLKMSGELEQGRVALLNSIRQQKNAARMYP